MAPIRLAPTFVLATSKSDILITEDFDPTLSKTKTFFQKLFDFSLIWAEGIIVTFSVRPKKFSEDK